MHSFASPRRHAAGRSWRGFAAASGGFTIIEILVVVAIIGILATIVAPRITRAMDNAKAQKCRNNLKQLHAAVLGYMADHGGDTPAAQSHELFNATNGKYSQSSSRGWIAWVPGGSRNPDDLQKKWEGRGSEESHAKDFYDDFGMGSDAKFAVENGELFDYAGDMAFYVCPLIRAKLAPAIELAPGSEAASDANGANIYRTYAMNPFFRCSQNPGWERLSSKIGVSYSYGGHVPEPSKLLLFTEIMPTTGHSKNRTSRTDEARGGDRAADGCINPEKWNSRGDDDEKIYAVHPSSLVRGKKKVSVALAVFFDGHIESVEPFTYGSGDTAKGNTAWFLNRGWIPGDKEPSKNAN